ncbi:ABC transporter ATP-binding protein [Cyanobium sp. CH-040]|uniref:ABC transporter ATP-binding protein n=1 Tax=Cyanobium sp. CH-040 TaxID=2823708 RepID=UPI0020CE36AC|nr:ABC transporter ATP-binding protein [Cyanobium sp. CH-040]MCP9927911.1 ABC transporter ATP-binding protein [Cyanobium sp. CH-040]
MPQSISLPQLARSLATTLGIQWSQEPASRLIRRTALEQWKLLALATASNLGRAALEGASLATVFLAVDLLSDPTPGAMTWETKPLISRLPALVSWLEALEPTRLFVGLILLAVALKLGQALLQFLNTVSVGWFTARCNRRIRGLIHRSITALSFACASGYRVGDLTELAGSAPETVRLEIEASNALVIQVLMGLTYLLVLIGLSPWLLLAAALIALVVLLLQKQLLPRIRRTANRLTAASVAISSRLTETIQGLRLLHSLGWLEAADADFHEQLGEQEAAQRRQALLLAVLDPISGLLPLLAIATIAVVSVLAFGTRASGVLPSLVVFVLALQRLNMALSGIASAYSMLSTNAANLERLNGFLRPEGKELRRRGGVAFAGLRDGILLEGVGLRYGADRPWVLRGIDLEIPRGRTVALVGASGAGKSSIADLLVGLYEPTEGRLLIDGVDLQALDLASWQRRLGVVSQDTFLLNATLAENIGFGCLGANRKAIAAATTRAQAAGFIASLPDGYDTLVGERGYRLSGGQRQRISLARAFLRDPELLILDEATSALDSASERLVQEAIEAFERQHTVLVIAHRLSTIVNADLIVVVDGGRIVERGSHSQLLESSDGFYRELWLRQSRARSVCVELPQRAMD